MSVNNLQLVNSSDDDVLRAINRGINTRAKLKASLRLSYDVIEKAIERNSADIRFRQEGSIEILSLKTSLPKTPEEVRYDDYATKARAQDCEPMPFIEWRERWGGDNDELKAPEAADESDTVPANCGCGRPYKHGGRCTWRRKNQPSLADELAEQRREVQVPKVVDKEELEDIEVDGYALYDNVDDCIEEIAGWTRERQLLFIDKLMESVEIPQQARTKILPAWSADFEADANSSDGILALTMMYLVSLLHYRMEREEKEAVWTLLQYCKKIQAAREEKR